MKIIRGYALSPNQPTELDLPTGCEVIAVHTLNGTGYLFALIDVYETATRRRTFSVVSDEQLLINDRIDTAFIGLFTLRDTVPLDRLFFVFEIVAPLVHAARRALTEMPL